VSELVV